ncbi:MAG: ABC transporter ATP-binding protein [Eggerthellaceae bacterium]
MSRRRAESDCVEGSSLDLQVHAHLHTHADGTVHNHYHSHPGGDLPHEHALDAGHSHQCAVDPSSEHVESSKIHAVESDFSSAASGEGRVFVETHDSLGNRPPLHRHTLPAEGHLVLEACDLAYSYGNQDGQVFEGIGLQAHAGSVLAILGNNGAGKSTLLGLLAGLLKPSAGTVKVGQRELGIMDRREVARHVAYVAQQQRVPHLGVYDQVLLGRKPHVGWSLTDYDRMVVSRTIAQLDLERFSQRFIDELSGGERQKVHIARALAQEPEVLLLDEPTSALDPKNQMEVLHVVREITREESIATIMVIHDINLALRFCDRFLLIRDGKVVAQGDRSVVTGESLSATYDMPFKVIEADGIPLALPLG